MSSQISITLPGYECQLDEKGALHSQLKVRSAALDLAKIGVNEQFIHTIPSNENETLNYRCGCSFQIVSLKNNLRFAMRSKQVAVPLGADFFPIATPRIQDVMRKVMNQINLTDEGMFNQTLKGSLASASFASSWNAQKDCIVTLNFNNPIHNRETSEISELIEWGESLCQECQITTLILRSKKMVLNVGRSPPFIDDTIHIRIRHDDGSIEICIESPEETSNSSKQSLIPIFYRKPEDAFQHPNSKTMAQALSWVLNTLKEITKESKRCVTKKYFMLEMYCGSGAHTMAISKSKLFEAIVAVEIDRRLVDALKVNSTLNDCNPEEGKDGDNTPVYIFQGDASEWASKSTLYRRRESFMEDANKMTKIFWFAQDYEVLLVDPPRSGLGEEVCNLALNGSFEHIIYVSCGREALVKDVAFLSRAFDVLDCTITDLFPRTSSIETLVHMRRRGIKDPCFE
mmetsp:Transcript_21492/g.31656  ORF Transcript_21492/g.31656 Transcript_21492/m.31656 type:complete len:458 (-) Transcript_21492:25-1398(-)